MGRKGTERERERSFGVIMRAPVAKCTEALPAQNAKDEANIGGKGGGTEREKVFFPNNIGKCS